MRKAKKPSSKAKVTARTDGREVFIVFVLALVLRIIGVGWGLPGPTHVFSYHPDEIFVLRPALGMLEGDWNPHFFNYGTFYLYLVGIVSSLFALVGLSPANAPDLGLLHLIGRIITAFLGAGTVALIYLIGRELGGRRLAQWASALLAVAPLHLVNSHFATVDVPGTFLLVLGAYGSLHIIREGGMRWYLLSGAAMGLAAATKYNFGVGILVVVAAHLLRGKIPGRQHTRLLAAIAMLPIFFLIGCPYALSLEGFPHIRKEFLAGLLFEAQHMQEVRTAAFVGAGSGWAYHGLRGLPAALGVPLYLLALGGIVRSLLFRNDQPARRGLLLLLGWLVFFFLMIGFATERFIRYLVPLVPFLCLFGAHAMDGLFRLRLKGLKVIAVGLGMALGLNLAYSVFQLLLFVVPDPRDDAFAALNEVGPKTVGVQEIPWFRTPPVSPFNGGVLSQSSFIKWQETAPYRVIVTGWQREVLTREQPEVFAISDLQYADALRLGDRRARDFMDALGNSYSGRRVFQNPTPIDWLGGGRRRSPPDWLYLKPVVSIYSGWKND